MATLFDWYHSTSLGQALLEEEKQLLSKECFPLCAGPSCLMIGDYPLSQPLFQHRFSQFIQVLERASLSPDNAWLRADYLHLPFPSESLPTVFLPHVLAFHPQPEKILAECWRVVSPEGHLIVLDFNPTSLLGLKKWIASNFEFPWNGHFLSATPLQRQLQKRGGEIILHKTFFYRPPSNHSVTLEKWKWCEKLFPHLFAGCGADFIFIAKKHIVPLRPLQNPLQWKKRFAMNNKTFPQPTVKI